MFGGIWGFFCAGGGRRGLLGFFFFSETMEPSFEDKSSVTHKVVYKIVERVSIRENKQKESSLFMV